MQHFLLRETTKQRKGLTIAALILLTGFLATTSAWGQIAVTGKITSGEDRGPLPGVNILIKGTTNGTISDADGNYQLTVSSSGDVLVFSFVGFISQEIPVGSNTRIDLVLAPDTKQLSEVVVTALGIEKDAGKIGYTTQKVQGSDLIKAREPNALNSLVGKVAGLTVGASAELIEVHRVVLKDRKSVV